MIVPPPDWLRDAGPHRLVLQPPGGAGRVVYLERLPPLSFVQVIATFASEAPGFTGGEWPSINRFVTDEGELGAWTLLEGTDRGRPCRRFIGAVWLDDYVAAIHSLGRDTTSDELVGATARRLLQAASYGLGLRRRRFVYMPPDQWGGVPNGAAVTWYPPNFPNHCSRIVVYPAEPSISSPDEEVERLFAAEGTSGFELSGSVLSTPIVSRGHLGGLRVAFGGAWRVDPTWVHRELALFTDGRYAYPMWLEATDNSWLAADIELFVRLAESVEPLPLPGARDIAALEGAQTALAGWSE